MFFQTRRRRSRSRAWLYGMPTLSFRAEELKLRTEQTENKTMLNGLSDKESRNIKVRNRPAPAEPVKACGEKEDRETEYGNKREPSWRRNRQDSCESVAVRYARTCSPVQKCFFSRTEQTVNVRHKTEKTVCRTGILVPNSSLREVLCARQTVRNGKRVQHDTDGNHAEQETGTARYRQKRCRI